MRLASLRWPILLVVMALLLGGGAFFVVRRPPEPAKFGKLDESAAREGLPRKVAQLLNQKGALRSLAPVPQAPVYVVLRRNGERLADGWFSGPDAQQAVIEGIESLTGRSGGLEAKVDTIELCLPHSPASARLREKKGVLGNAERGVLGIYLKHGDFEQRVCPTQMIARNAKFEDVEGQFRKEAKLSESEYVDDARAESFEAHQLLIQLGEQPAIVPMFRGNKVVPMEAVNRKGVQELADGLSTWLTTHVQPDGRMVYMYLPSRGRESDDNNMIRQFMATVCLVRIANERPDDARLRELAHRNLKYNLDHFFVTEGELGLIKFGDVRLGAVALAALAIVEAPFRKEFERYELALRKTTIHMQKPDGSFFSFFGSESDANQNFYPGEALLLWSTLLDQAPEPELSERFERAWRYYRTWHLEHRNPAFIPWHTQAYVKLLKKKDDPELREWVFEMNDWLLGVQQWDTAPYPDALGRFYDPDRPFGPPHASSTAVYLEGLIDAYQLAVQHNDKERAAKYRLSILRGLRSTMQLQYLDAVDMYYIAKRDRVFGGLRTTEYDNRIRVDNVQHALMGIQRILRTFNAEGNW